MKRRTRSALATAALWVGAAALVLPAAGQAAFAATPVQLRSVIGNLETPVLVTNAKDGSDRLFIVEQGGVIKVLPPGGRSATVFLDLSDKVIFKGERGLLGLTFHPQFGSNRRFFVDYTRMPDGATVIAEYHASPTNPNVANPTGTVLLVIPQPFANHNGGMVEFGHDGFLYVGMGDGGSANDPGNRAQDIAQLLGKILRIDVDHPAGNLPYSSPADNPFFGAVAGRHEIFAYGLRNPFRFSFDRVTGDLYAGDVGQGAVEEIDIITNGGNYGWRIWEGSTCTGNDPALCSTAGFEFPIAEYGHTGGRCAVIGGYVYRGAAGTLPDGSYVYGDLCAGEIFLLENGTPRVLLRAGFSISSFGEDEAGEIYVVDIGGAVNRIAIRTGCAIGLSPIERLVTSRAIASSQVRIMAASGCAWTAVSNAPWISITGGATGSGRGSVTYAIARNPGGSARTGTITVNGEVFTIIQAGRGRKPSAFPLLPPP
jgi:glucose/arabinose dehydrogenase